MPKKPSQEADQGQKTIEQIPLADLIPYARNARTHSAANISQLCGSLREFGWVNPVLIDADNNIIAGHGRVMAAQQLGMMTAPCLRISHLTDAQRRAYILADNSLALNSGWDEDLLKIELADLQLAEFDVSLLGFSEEQLGAFAVSEVPPPELKDGDRAPFRQATFTLHDDQWATVEEAIAAAKADGHGKSELNENSNGNALAWIAEAFING